MSHRPGRCVAERLLRTAVGARCIDASSTCGLNAPDLLAFPTHPRRVLSREPALFRGEVMGPRRCPPLRPRSPSSSSAGVGLRVARNAALHSATQSVRDDGQSNFRASQLTPCPYDAETVLPVRHARKAGAAALRGKNAATARGMGRCLSTGGLRNGRRVVAGVAKRVVEGTDKGTRMSRLLDEALPRFRDRLALARPSERARTLGLE
jgi:hypothetical protein